MTVQTRSTKKPLSGSLSVATKKRPILYIPESDPRNNKSYINDYPGQIIVLTEAEYSAWLRQEYSVSYSSNSNFNQTNDSEDITQFGNALTDIAAPGIPSWDQTNISYVSSDTGILQNITITFEPSPDDPGDGSFTYHVNYVPSTATTVPTTSNATVTTNIGSGTTAVPITGSGSSGSAQTSAATASNISATVDTSKFQTISTLPTLISIEWPIVSSATNYSVVITGENIPGTLLGSVDTHTYVMPALGGICPSSSYAEGYITSGYYTFMLSSQSGHNFTGTYSISLQVNYSTGSSLPGGSYSVTI